MSMKPRLKILVGVLGTVVVLTIILLVAFLFPALNRMRQAREEHQQIEREIQRALLEVRLRSHEAAGDEDREVPELPEIAACVASLLRAAKDADIDDLTFDSLRTEKQEFMLAAGMDGGTREYLVSRLNANFSSSVLQAARFLETAQGESPDEAFDYLRISGRSTGEDKVDVSMLFRLCGVPR
jgi:hypothetical protein